MGFSVDLQEDLLAVGIPGANGNAGRVEVFEFQRDSWQWEQNPSIFEGVTTTIAGSSNYGAAISMTPSGDFVIGYHKSNDNIGSVNFYRREIA